MRDQETEMDVIVFEAGDRRFAMELRFVQEVFTLGYVTPVPLTPATVQGATNVRGRMVPVISLQPFFGAATQPHVLPGTPAILVQAEENLAALPVKRVIDVISVPRHRFERGGEGSGPLIPGSFRGAAGSIPLLDVGDALSQIRRAAEDSNRRIHERSEAR